MDQKIGLTPLEEWRLYVGEFKYSIELFSQTAAVVSASLLLMAETVAHIDDLVKALCPFNGGAPNGAEGGGP